MESLLGKELVVFSGGSAANHLVDVFNQVIEAKGCRLNYIIPISDNGGSSSELIRVFGGPGIGDLRSRLVRLIPDEKDDGSERRAIKSFFNHRLSSNPREARVEWLDIVESSHPLWRDIDSAKKELIRSYLNLLNSEIVKRARPSSVFGFESASVGNLFLTGARIFSGSLESAIYLLSSICGISPDISVLPAINTNFSHHICAGLANGDRIPGQNAISHPSIPTALQPFGHSSSSSFAGLANGSGNSTTEASPTRIEIEDADTIEDANLPGSLPTLRKKHINFSKDEEEDLPARIERIWYINPYGQEIRPPPNPKVLATTRSASSIIYSIGSLYTSLVPSLILRGVGEAILRSAASTKILILNGSTDRETGPSTKPFSAMEFIKAIARAGIESQGEYGREPETHELRNYVTHLIHLEGDGAPKVDKVILNEAGIETIRLYGRMISTSKGWKYDEKVLSQTLSALIGQKTKLLDRSRRNTMEV